MNLNTPHQPNDNEIRTFSVGPMSEEEFALQPDIVRDSVERVATGVAEENDDDVFVVAPSTRNQIGCVLDEVLATMEGYMLRVGVTQQSVHDAILRIIETDGKEMPEESPENFQVIYRRTIRNLVTQFLIAVEEILVNHAKHGNRDPRLSVGGRYWIDENGVFHIVSWDEGPGFNVEGVADPRDPARIEVPNGRGRLLAKGFSDSFEDGFEGSQGKLGTSVHMTRNLHQPDLHSPESVTAFDRHVQNSGAEIFREQKEVDKQAEQRRIRRTVPEYTI